MNKFVFSVLHLELDLTMIAKFSYHKEIHSRLDHSNIVSLIGAGFTPRGVRFVVLERLDGGTLTQLLGYDNRIRDRRRRFWAKKKISYMDVLKCARSLADALAYCHGRAIPNAMVLHRDLKVSLFWKIIYICIRYD